MTKTYNDIEAVTRLLEEVNMTADMQYIYRGVQDPGITNSYS